MLLNDTKEKKEYCHGSICFELFELQVNRLFCFIKHENTCGKSCQTSNRGR